MEKNCVKKQHVARQHHEFVLEQNSYGQPGGNGEFRLMSTTATVILAVPGGGNVAASVGMA